ncbi:MAG TPA: DUF4034 domain-containing protein [Planctomycetota bacterium]|nr:DUF4034 domain-containing protein [Planctomycetota bacterium]
MGNIEEEFFRKAAQLGPHADLPPVPMEIARQTAPPRPRRLLRVSLLLVLVLVALAGTASSGYAILQIYKKAVAQSPDAVPAALPDTKLKTPDEKRADDATKAMNASFKLPRPTMQEITDLVLKERFSEFEEKSKELEAQFARDPAYELPLYTLYGALDPSNEELSAKLDKWVAAHPSYVSYTARGMYKVNRGYEIRGTDWASNTPREKMAQMSKLHFDARSDAIKAFTNKPAFPIAYIVEILALQSGGGTSGKKGMYERGIKNAPSSYYIRNAYLHSVLPRWGGSYALMDEATSNLKKECELNPQLWNLKSEAPIDKADCALRNSDYAGALSFCTLALSFGERAECLRLRGLLYLNEKNKNAALKDFLRYQHYEPNDAEINAYVKLLQAL